jgi:hypothetical protein
MTVPSSSTIWPGIASRVTPSIVVVGATLTEVPAGPVAQCGLVDPQQLSHFGAGRSLGNPALREAVRIRTARACVSTSYFFGAGMIRFSHLS